MRAKVDYQLLVTLLLLLGEKKWVGSQDLMDADGVRQTLRAYQRFLQHQHQRGLISPHPKNSGNGKLWRLNPEHPLSQYFQTPHGVTP